VWNTAKLNYEFMEQCAYVFNANTLPTGRSNVNSDTKPGADLLHTTANSCFNHYSRHNVCSPSCDCECI